MPTQSVNEGASLEASAELNVSAAIPTVELIDAGAEVTAAMEVTEAQQLEREALHEKALKSMGMWRSNNNPPSPETAHLSKKYQNRSKY